MINKGTAWILALLIGFIACQEPAGWHPRVGFMMDGWRFVYIWRPSCPGGFRIGDVVTFIDVPPRQGLYCVNSDSLMARSATSFEPGFTWEAGSFTFYRPALNSSEEAGWGGLGNVAAIKGSRLVNYAVFPSDCLVPCQTVQDVTLNLGVWGVHRFITFNPLERFNYSGQDTNLFIINTENWAPQCIHEKCVCDSCGIRGRCTEFGYCECERGWTGKRCDEPITMCNNPTDTTCPTCPPDFELTPVNGRYICTDANDCSIGDTSCRQLGYTNCTYTGDDYVCTNCSAGYYEDPFGDCTVQLCGNGVLDEGEECDSGHMCQNCQCVHGAETTFPESVDCIDQCSGGLGCDLSSCTCMRNIGFWPVGDEQCFPMSPCVRHTGCSSCQDNDCTWFGQGICQMMKRFTTGAQVSCESQQIGGSDPVSVQMPLPDQPLFEAPYTLNRDTEVIIIVVSIVGGTLIILVVIAIILLIRRRRNQYTNINNNDAPHDGYRNMSYNPPVRNSAVPRAIQSIEWQPKETLFTEYKRFPLTLSKTKLDFGLNLNQMRVGQTYVDTFVLSINQMSSHVDASFNTVLFSMHPPLSPKFSVIYTPESGEVKKDKPVEVKVLLTCHMTTEADIITGIELPQMQLHTFITQHMISEISPLVDFDELIFDFQNVIGDGSYGTVFRGTYRGQEVAIKILKVQEMPQEIFEEFEREIDLMNKLRHKNIVQFIGASKVPNKLSIITEFIEMGNVASLLAKGPVSYALKLKIALDAARALSFLHSNGILHRDLKPENLLLNSKSTDLSTVTVKMADFGTSRAVSEKIIANKLTSGIGTPIYMAPEILEGENYGLKADIFSFGILLWVLFQQKAPYEFLKFSWDIPEFILSGKREKIPEECPKSYSDLIEACWAADPEERPTAVQLTKILERMMVLLLEDGAKEIDSNLFKKPKVNRPLPVPPKRFIIKDNEEKSGFVDLDEHSISNNNNRKF